jgi:hypothetical protein
MKMTTKCSVLWHFLKRSALALVVVGAPLAHATTVWTGPLTNYVQSQPYTPSDPKSEDQLTALVVLTRDSTLGLYNVVTQTSYGGQGEGSGTPDGSPSDTEWAIGSISDYATLSYGSWDDMLHGLDGVGQQAVLHLITDDIYISIEFTAWGSHGAGGFAYTRSTPAASSPAVPTVTATIYEVAAGSSFAYTITLQNTGTNALNSFWYGWTTSGDNLPSAPSSAANSLGWSNDLSGNSIKWTNSSGTALAPGDSATFTFDSSSSPSAITTAPSGESVAYVGAIDFTESTAGDSTAPFSPTLVNPPTPIVSITNPASGSVFAAPATVALGVSASVTGGTVTNVAYFTNGILAGSSTVAPFSLTLQNVHVASYALTAVATAAGVSATSAVVNISVVPPPSVSITNPAGGAVFAAPANVHIGARASVVMGSVTNVSFFSGSTLLGSATVAPFSLNANNLSANSYALTAVATAAGLSTTSAVVNISVVNPVAISNSAPMVANNQFTFSYAANPGLTYMVQKSSNLVNWVSLSTNVASSSPVQVTDAFVPTNSQYYRVGLAPNP